MALVSKHWMAPLIAVLVLNLHASPAVADRSAPRAAQTYSIFHPQSDVSPYDNPNDTAAFPDLDELSRYLLRMAVRMSKYRMPATAPKVTRVPRHELEMRGCSHPNQACKVSALFVASRGVMIAQDLRPETNLFDRSILFHELVHYLQEEARELATSAPCDRWFQREQEAYALQNRYLIAVSSPMRVGYGGGRPTCDGDTPAHAHSPREVSASGGSAQTR
ncbi:MAG: hypothetical protein GC151_09725 [Betaproteobacteria bacterium]|nr:hypothetical protein [Betaproteobacteria bacterium]